MADVGDFTTWSSTAASNQPQGGTVVGTGLDDNLRQIEAEVAKWRDGMGYGVLNGTSVAGTNTVTFNTSPAPTLASGQTYRILVANSNTQATTAAPNGASAKNVFLNGAALVGYEFRKNTPVDLYYDGTQFNIIAGAHGGDGIPIGRISDRAFATVPNGHLLCDGSAVSRATYADLFAVLSTTWGAGDGSTTFNVPSLSRRVTVGSGGSGTATLANTVGSTGGEETHTLSQAELPTGVPFTGGTVGTDSTNSTGGIAIPKSSTAWGAGSGTAFNVIQPSAVVYKVIKY